jgi:hypothetical protein
MSVQHQYNATYFSACKEDPKLYLMARAVQFFTPGVPMVYYVVGASARLLLFEFEIDGLPLHCLSQG